MTGSVQPYCEGRGCPKKLDCCRYKVSIDRMKEDYFPFSPYNGALDKCGFYVGKTIEKLKPKINGAKNDSFREDGEDSGV